MMMMEATVLLGRWGFWSQFEVGWKAFTDGFGAQRESNIIPFLPHRNLIHIGGTAEPTVLST